MRLDIRAEFDRIIEQMEWGDVLETLEAVIDEALGGTPNPLPTTPPLSPVPTELGCDNPPQPAGDVNGGCSSDHLGIAPHSFMQPVTAAPNFMQGGPLHGQAGVHSQAQHMLHQSAVYNHPGPSTPAYYPAAPPHTYNNAPVTSFYDSTGQNLVPLRLVNGEVVYAEILHPYSAAPPAPTFMSQKRKYKKQHDDSQPYIKKPLNAFMLFIKEQRQNVVTEININDSAIVNRFLGQRWASLSKEEKAKYYEKAEEEKLLHAKQNPGWSPSDNYGKKRKRQWNKAKEQQTEQTAVTDASTSHTALETPHTQSADMGSSTSQTVVETLPHMETPVSAVDSFARLLGLSRRESNISSTSPTSPQMT